jgi:3-hydroxyisobutyrate dehydrogenase-like beta-hydroxyacid dehydrogenase
MRRMTGLERTCFPFFTLGRIARTNTLAIIAAGAMGSAIARRMAENGLRVLASLKRRSQATTDRAHQAGMISASDEEIAAHAELVLSVVPPGEALSGAPTLRL